MKLLLAAQLGRRDQLAVDSLVGDLERSLIELGHEVDVFRLPVIESPEAAMEYALAMGLFDLGADADRLITLGWHCHLLRHPAKIALVHQLDPLLDLQPTAAHSRAALSAAFRSARRVVVDAPSAKQFVRRLSGAEPMTCSSPLAGREAAESWLD